MKNTAPHSVDRPLSRNKKSDDIERHRQSKLAKRNNSQSQPGRSIVNADIFHTLNFLFQRAYQLEIADSFSANRSNGSKFLVRQLFSLARRAVIRLDPTIKHSVCHKCWRILIEGITCNTTVQRTSVSFAYVQNLAKKR